jgi:hypothetical protein
MKKMLLIVLLFTACTTTSVAPTFKSMEGVWKFSSAEVNGQFTLTMYNGILTTDNTGSWASINGNRFEVTQKYAVEGKQPNPVTIFLLGPVGTNAVTFRNVNVNKEYNVLTPLTYDYYTNNKVTVGTSKITITR